MMLREAPVSTRKMSPETASVRKSNGLPVEAAVSIHRRWGRFPTENPARHKGPDSVGLLYQTADDNSSSRTGGEEPGTRCDCGLSGKPTSWRQ